MAVKYDYKYAGVPYNTLAAAQDAVPEFKNKLDNCPTNWVVVKQLERSSTADGWVVLPRTLTDAEINSLDATKNYTLWSLYTGDSFVGLSASEITEKVSFYRTAYANAKNAGNVVRVNPTPPNPEQELIPEEHALKEFPTDIDMSGYLS